MDDVDRIYLRYFITIVIATIMTVIVALVLRKVMSDQPNIIFVALMMIVTAILLLYRPNMEKKLNKGIEDLGLF